MEMVIDHNDPYHWLDLLPTHFWTCEAILFWGPMDKVKVSIYASKTTFKGKRLNLNSLVDWIEKDSDQSDGERVNLGICFEIDFQLQACSEVLKQLYWILFLSFKKHLNSNVKYCWLVLRFVLNEQCKGCWNNFF